MLIVVRILWVLIILGCCTVFTYMLSTKLAYLASSPTNVDVNVEFKQSMQFPAVTVCNLNPYRYRAFSDARVTLFAV